jgi:hypothetical protein
MNENLKWIAAAVGVVGLSIGAIIYFARNDRVAPPQKPVAATPAPAPVLPEEPAIKHPLPEPPAQERAPRRSTKAIRRCKTRSWIWLAKRPWTSSSNRKIWCGTSS